MMQSVAIFLVILWFNVGISQPTTCNSNSTTCNPHMHATNMQCAHVEECCKDALDDIFINYLSVYYCDFDNYKAFGLILYVILVIYYFLIIGNIADIYFAPIMEEISDILKISPELAGVTFVALGNGSPDISSSVSAISNGGNKTLLGLGALLGAAMFNTSIVTGIIAIYCNNAQVARRPFLRDCIVLMIATSCILFITTNQYIMVYGAFGMIFVYLIYVVAILLGEIHKKIKNKHVANILYEFDVIHKQNKQQKIETIPKTHLTVKDKFILHASMALSAFSNNSMENLFSFNNSIKSDTLSTQSNHLQLHTPLLISNNNSNSIQMISIHSSQQTTQSNQTDTTIAMSTISDIELEEDTMKSYSLWLRVIIYIIRGPTLLIDFLCKYIIPLTNPESWNDSRAMISCITAPIFIQFSFGFITESVNKIPIVIFTAIFGVLMSILSYYFIRLKYKKYPRKYSVSSTHSKYSTNPAINYKLKHQLDYDVDEIDIDPHKQAVMKWYFLMIAFLCSVSIIKFIANELVNLLTTFGIISTIDLTLLGLTVLAWGNCIGDMISDVSISRRGAPKMGISAAISAPTLNVLIGVGLGTAINTLSEQDYMDIIPNTPNIFVCCIGVLVQIILLIIFVSFNQWRFTKLLGYISLINYSIFIVINVLVYKNVIVFSWIK